MEVIVFLIPNPFQATDHAADSYSQQLLTSLAEVFSQAVPQDGADDSLGASETDKSAFEYVDPHHLSKVRFIA